MHARHWKLVVTFQIGQESNKSEDETYISVGSSSCRECIAMFRKVEFDFRTNHAAVETKNLAETICKLFLTPFNQYWNWLNKICWSLNNCKKFARGRFKKRENKFLVNFQSEILTHIFHFLIDIKKSFWEGLLLEMKSGFSTIISSIQKYGRIQDSLQRQQ